MALALTSLAFGAVAYAGPVLQGPILQGPILQGPVLQGMRLNGPGIILNGPSAHDGVSNPARSTGVTIPSVKLVDGRLISR